MGDNLTTVIQQLASSIGAYKRCEQSKNDEWMVKHFNTIKAIEKQYLPSGSGIDNGSHVLIDDSTENKVVIETSYHHMTEGMYDGWTGHRIIVTPTFQGIDVKVTGRDRNQIKDYLGDVFHESLSEDWK